VTVTNVTVSGATQNAIHGDIANETQSVMTVNGTTGADTVASSASSTVAIVFHGGGGADTFTGHNELDTATYGVALTSANITYDISTGQWVVNAGAEGVLLARVGIVLVQLLKVGQAVAIRVGALVHDGRPRGLGRRCGERQHEKRDHTGNEEEREGSHC